MYADTLINICLKILCSVTNWLAYQRGNEQWYFRLWCILIVNGFWCSLYFVLFNQKTKLLPQLLPLQHKCYLFLNKSKTGRKIFLKSEGDTFSFHPKYSVGSTRSLIEFFDKKTNTYHNVQTRSTPLSLGWDLLVFI